MKKIISLLVLLCLLLGALASCNFGSDENPPKQDGGVTDNGGSGEEDKRPGDKEDEGGKPEGITSIPDGMTGKDILKLLLANERLGGKIINDTDGIFKGGKETFARLKSEAIENLEASVLTVQSSGGVPSLEDAVIGELLAQSNEFLEFDQLSRNYAEFEETTKTIIGQAERASDMIDYVKKYVRIVDTWVKMPGYTEEIYLHVEENSETVYARSSDRYTVCHRYKNEAGDDVYELYDNGSFEDIRSTYIAGKKYELIRCLENGGRYQGISAQNNKGYWEIFEIIYDSAWADYSFDTGFIIMKDDICYRVGYSLRENYPVVVYKITSSDRTTDIFTIDEGFEGLTTFELNLGAFDGYYGVIDVDSGNMGKLKLADGTLIDHTLESVYDENGYTASVGAVYATVSAFGTEGSVLIKVHGEDPEMRREVLATVIERWGLECKFDMAKTFEAIDRADAEFFGIRKYLKWNGHDVNTLGGLTAGVGVEVAKFSSAIARYEAVKDAKVVEIGTSEAELLISFAPITEASFNGAVSDGITVTFGKISLKAEDMMLFVKDEDYKIALAMKSLADGTLAHIDAEIPTVKYDGGASLTAAAENLTVTLPMLAYGEYELVAYIKAADGIRSTSFINVKVESATGEEIKRDATIVKATKSANGYLSVEYIECVDISAEVMMTAPVTYEALYEAISEIVFAHGTPTDNVISKLDGEGESALTGDEALIEDGVYKMGYELVNGDKKISGSVYLTLTVEIPEIPEDGDGNADGKE